MYFVFGYDLFPCYGLYDPKRNYMVRGTLPHVVRKGHGVCSKSGNCSRRVALGDEGSKSPTAGHLNTTFGKDELAKVGSFHL